MPFFVDTSTFQLGLPSDLDPHEELEEAAQLEALWEDARAYVKSRTWAPFVAEILLAYGLGPIVGLFFVRFSAPPPSEIPDERERWVVVGDGPYMNFETEDAPTPDLALRLYCAICQDWADNVLAGADLSDSYPIPVEPTQEHAEMLLSRVKFIRTEIVPIAEQQVRAAASGDRL
jgi:hypothetical protein